MTNIANPFEVPAETVTTVKTVAEPAVDVHQQGAVPTHIHGHVTPGVFDHQEPRGSVSATGARPAHHGPPPPPPPPTVITSKTIT